MTRSRFIVAAAVYVAYAAGNVVGYYIGKGEAKKRYEKELEIELALSKHYKEMRKIKKKAAKRQAKEEALTVFEEVQDDNPYDLPWDPEDLDYEEEQKHRSDEAPYVISKNEYKYDKPQFAKLDLEYYREEDVLLDETPDPVQDVDNTLGYDNLKRFGHGSGDRRLVYIRNEELESDFEVRLMMGSYAIDVLGLDDPNDKGLRWEPPPR